MTELDTGISPATRLSTILPVQRRRVPQVAVLDPGDVQSAAVENAHLSPAREMVRPVETTATRRRTERHLILAGDAVAGALAAVVDWRLGLLAATVVVPATTLAGLQRRRFSLSTLDEAPQLLKASAWVAGAMVMGALALGMAGQVAVVAALVTVAALFAFRAAAYGWIRALRRDGRSVHPVVLVGQASADLARRIQEHPEMGMRVIGTVDAQGELRFVEGGTASTRYAFERLGVRDVILDPCGDNDALSAWVRELSWRDLSVHMVMPQVGAAPSRGWDDHVWGVPLIRMQSSLRWRRMRFMKRAMDIVVAGAALAWLAPLLGVVALFVRREVGPNIIFRQQRVGLDGRTFEVLKFRSMRDPRPGEESAWAAQRTSADRVGPVGRLIRKYSIDELPQLWNILRGDMSLVGPRPERPEYVRQFSVAYPHYWSRHRAPVGLTGLAAVEGLRGDTSIDDRAYFDNLYVDSWTFWGDLKIVARTALAVVRGTGS